MVHGRPAPQRPRPRRPPPAAARPRAQILARQAHPVGGNNVAPAELERARRVSLGRGFEAAYLGRRL